MIVFARVLSSLGLCNTFCPNPCFCVSFKDSPQPDTHIKSALGDDLLFFWNLNCNRNTWTDLLKLRRYQVLSAKTDPWFEERPSILPDICSDPVSLSAAVSQREPELLWHAKHTLAQLGDLWGSRTFFGFWRFQLLLLLLKQNPELPLL